MTCVLPETYRLFRAVFFGLVPALLNKSLCGEQYSKAFYKHYCTNLSALLLWYLLALLNWDICTLLRGHLPASDLRHLQNTLRKSEQ